MKLGLTVKQKKGMELIKREKQRAITGGTGTGKTMHRDSDIARQMVAEENFNEEVTKHYNNFKGDR